jgi:Mn2+/Fe2+ NRAMP family transporter
MVEPSKPRLLKVLGPGLVTGAADDDPSGIYGPLDLFVVET